MEGLLADGCSGVGGVEGSLPDWCRVGRVEGPLANRCSGVGGVEGPLADGCSGIEGEMGPLADKGAAGWE